MRRFRHVTAVAALVVGCGGRLAEIADTPEDASTLEDAPIDGTVVVADASVDSSFDASTDAVTRDAAFDAATLDANDATFDSGLDANLEDAAFDAPDAFVMDAQVDGCISARCDALGIAASSNPITGLAADDTAAYWHDGDLRSTPVGGGVPTTLVEGVACNRALLASTDYVYWVSSERIAIASKVVNGGFAYLGAGASKVDDIALDANGLWFVRRSDTAGIASELWKWASPKLPVTAASIQFYVGSFLSRVTGNGEFSFQYIPENGSFFRVDEQTGAVASTANDAELAEWVMGPTDVYWVTKAGDLKTLLAAGTTRGLLAAGHSVAGDPVGIARDATGIFWIDRGVWALPTGTTTPLLLSAATNTANVIAVDTGYVFFVLDDGSTGRRVVVRIAKP